MTNKYENMIPRFVGGTGRCGTTLVHKILQQVEQLACFYETKFLTEKDGLMPLAQGRTDLGTFSERIFNCWRPYYLRDCVQGEWRNLMTVEMYRDADRLVRILQEAFGRNRPHPESFQYLLRSLYGEVTQSVGKSQWVEKTPHTIIYTNILYALLSDMRFLHVIRDPRDIYCSLLHVDWGPKTIPAFVQWYHKYMQHAYQLQQSAPPDQYMVMSMERLVLDPQRSIDQMLNFFGLQVDPNQFDRCCKIINPQATHIRRWHRELDANQAGQIMQSCGPLYDLWRLREQQLHLQYCQTITVPERETRER